MSEYIPRVVDAEVGEAVEIPDSARDIEVEYYTIEHSGPGIGSGGGEDEHRVRIKYLERLGDSVR